MTSKISIIALAAVATLLSGCGCSKEKKRVDGPKERMADVAYTEAIGKLRKDQSSAAAKIAAIRERIEKLGGNASASLEYVSLTNDLARCTAEFEMIRKTTQMAVRDRLMKDAAKKGDLKK